MKLNSLFRRGAALALMAAAWPASAVITITVNDTATPDSYTNGVGGIFTGSNAIQEAANAIFFDPTADSFDVQIVDTDGVADTYTGAFSMTKANVRVRQVDGGPHDDAAATIVGDGTGVPAGLPAIFAQASGFELRGLSAAKPLTINGGPHAQATGLNVAGGNTAIWENLTYVDGGPAGYDHADYNGTGIAGAQLFRNCTFSADNGPYVQIVGTRLENCAFNASGFKMHAATNSNVTVTTSTFSASVAGLIVESAVLSVSGSTFNSVSRIIGSVAPQGWFANSTLNIDNCTFNGNNGDVMFWVGDVGGTVNVSNSNMVNAATVLTGRITAGAMNFTNCNITGRAIDTAGAIQAGGATITFDRSTVTGAQIGAGANSSSAGPLRIRAINSVFNPNGLQSVLVTDTDSTVDDDIITTHCTFYGPSANVLLDMDNNDTITASYTIFDASQAVSTSANGVRPLNGVGNLVHPTGFTAIPGDTITGQPANLDGTGRPNAGSFAINNAAASPMLVDRDNLARPLGFAKDIGAYETAAVPVELSGFTLE